METGNDLSKLTEREKACLRQWLHHKSAKEIAIDLGISHHAVEKRLKMARLKLGVATSLQAAQMLGAVEGYGQTVPQAPVLAPVAPQHHSSRIRPLIWGVIPMTLAVAALLVFGLQPVAAPSPATQNNALVRAYDEQLVVLLDALIATAEVGPDGEVVLRYPLPDRRFLQFDSGHYWQISGAGHPDLYSRSLGARTLASAASAISAEALLYTSDQFPGEPLRVAERTVQLPKSRVKWRFVIAQRCGELCEDKPHAG